MFKKEFNDILINYWSNYNLFIIYNEILNYYNKRI